MRKIQRKSNLDCRNEGDRQLLRGLRTQKKNRKSFLHDHEPGAMASKASQILRLIRYESCSRQSTARLTRGLRDCRQALFKPRIVCISYAGTSTPKRNAASTIHFPFPFPFRFYFQPTARLVLSLSLYYCTWVPRQGIPPANPTQRGERRGHL